MALMDDFQDDEQMDLSQIPGFESLADQTDEEEIPPINDDEGDEPGDGDADPAAVAARRKADGVSRAEFETVVNQNKELIAMMREQAARPPAPVYINPPQQQATPQQMQQQREALEQQYYADPLGTTARIAAQQAQGALGNEIAAMRETLAQQTVQNFRQNLVASDPQFAKAAAKYFDEQIGKVPARNLSSLSPQQMNEFLQYAETAAWGRVMVEMRKKQPPAQRQQTQGGGGSAPLYGGAGGGRGGSGGGVRQGRGQTTQSQLDKFLGLTQADYDGIIE